MTQRFRVLLITSVALLVAAALIPFEHPYEATFAIDRPPLAPVLISLLVLISALALPFALYGLLRFKPWAPNLAALVAVALIGLTLAVLLPSDFTGAIAGAAKISVLAGTSLWGIAVVLAKTRPLRDRFRIAL